MDRSTSEEGQGNREAFAFGKNWSQFLQQLNEERIASAEQSLRQLLQQNGFEGMRVLDAGSGSGLFSLAAYRMGADVTSFDVDPDSVGCTRALQNQYGDNERWRVHSGSLLDAAFLRDLGLYDVVYCWGVAHHTGDMWKAIDQIAMRVDVNGRLVLAIYNDQLYVSRIWYGIKRIYQKLPKPLRPLYVLIIYLGTFLKRLTTTLGASMLRCFTLRNPLVPWLRWARETQGRGMHGWYDLVDWVGGWPFEVARPEAIFRFLRDRGFQLEEMTTVIGHGCNEYVLRRERMMNESRRDGNSISISIHRTHNGTKLQSRIA